MALIMQVHRYLFEAAFLEIAKKQQNQLVIKSCKTMLQM